jgi:hypothetical protein
MKHGTIRFNSVNNRYEMPYEWSHEGPGQCFDFNAGAFTEQAGGYDPGSVFGDIRYRYHDGTVVTPQIGSTMADGERYESVPWNVKIEDPVTPEQVAAWTVEEKRGCFGVCRAGYTPAPLPYLVETNSTEFNTKFNITPITYEQVAGVPAPYLQTRSECQQWIPKQTCRKDGIWTPGTPVDVYWGDELVNVVNV